ncbi:MAG: lipid A deacylase LpxR family protein, partial [Bacteroidetes bacterium]|nr:lipid A deacylase LpxR family protein [Bacteroidota bacterium]
KEVFNLSNLFSTNLLSQIQVGNLKTNLSVGAEMRIGNKIWQRSSDQQLHFSLYSQSWTHVIGYDATLQGGLFNQTSVHVLPSSEINRLVFEQHVGFQIFRNRLSFAFDFAYRTQEYSKGTHHFWGGIRIARMFKQGLN